MKNFSLFLYFLVFSASNLICYSQEIESKNDKIKNILCFNPEIFPDVEEIKSPTHDIFFQHIGDKIPPIKQSKITKINASLNFENPEPQDLISYCKYNDADFVLLSLVKYFKVGLGKYVFSNQVLIKLKLFNAEGFLIAESEYNTYKKNIRLLGSTEHSLKIGTKGALKLLKKQIRKNKKL